MKALLIVGFFILSVNAFSQESSLNSCPALASLQIDGLVSDWPMTWEKDPEGQFSYNVCADETNLYVRVKTDVDFIKRKMAAFGFTIWIDPSGKKKKKLGLKFPVGGSEAEERAAPLKALANTKNQSLSQRAEIQHEIDVKLIEGVELIELIGLADDPLTSTRSGITNGIKVAIACESEGAYVYEAAIPFKSYRLSYASLSEIGVGFETGKYIPPKAKPVKGAEVRDFTSATNMARWQGYSSLIGNPKLSYPSGLWTSIKLK